MKQKKEQQLREAIGRILEWDWDPIGMRRSVPEDWNEYHSYIGGVLRLLVGGASERKIADHLAQLERVSMGLSGANEERRTETARKLRGLIAEATPPAD